MFRKFREILENLEKEKPRKGFILKLFHFKRFHCSYCLKHPLNWCLKVSNCITDIYIYIYEAFQHRTKEKSLRKKYRQYLCQPKDVLFKQLLVKAAGVNWWVL